jgi:hypothetical protein
MPFRYRPAQPDSVGGRQSILIMRRATLRASRGGTAGSQRTSARAVPCGGDWEVIRGAAGYPWGEPGLLDLSRPLRIFVAKRPTGYGFLGGGFAGG